jgi:hypothetical protein
MLSDKIERDFKEAMKSKDLLKVETLRMLKAAVANFLIEKRKDKVEDQELLGLIQKQIKLREDSIESFRKGNRPELLEKETKEKALLQAYLPSSLTPAELEEIVRQTIQATGASSKADIGKVMKEALARAQGRADGKTINQIALRLLG